jgi:precorrin-2 dehydrogenase/sirohydrochlorin ferrochelatase
MLPLLHDFTAERVLVFGGGSVGARKARILAREADVVAISPAFADADFGSASRVRAAPDAEDVAAWLDRAAPALVVAATDDASLNAAIAEAARERGVLVNRADASEGLAAGNVALPAIARDGPVVVGVGTGGRSPALAAHLRDRIASEIDGAGAMAELTADLRADLIERGLPPGERHAALRALVADRELWTALDTGGSKPRQRAVDVINDVTGELL